tara:strand:+ start:15528 stop:16349 length:822 start_codon:yes stop_codon:yes gene_type:complete
MIKLKINKSIILLVLLVLLLLINIQRFENFSNYNNYTESSYFPFESLKCYKPKKPKIRLGKNNDGGYVIVEGYEYDLMIGCGISKDSSFEHSFLKKYPNVPIDTYDGTINSFPNSHPKIKFTKKNIGGTNTEKTTNLHSLIEPKNNIFLKMDIEGGEYDWLHSLSKKQLNKFQQIVIEFHKPFSADRYKTLEKLADTHNLIHIHGNNYGSIIKKKHKGKIVTIPTVFECTYIRKDSRNLRLNDKSFPINLDQPNKPDTYDITLLGYPYSTNTK